MNPDNGATHDPHHRMGRVARRIAFGLPVVGTAIEFSRISFRDERPACPIDQAGLSTIPAEIIRWASRTALVWIGRWPSGSDFESTFSN